MNKKTQLIFLTFLFVILIITVKSVLSVKITQYTINYEGENFLIKEKNTNEFYYIEIKKADKVYPVKINIDVKGENKIVDKVYYYKDKKYECLLPVGNKQALGDMQCYNNNFLYNYHVLMGKNSKLDTYVKSIEEYNIDNYIDDMSKVKKEKTLNIYKRNTTDINIYMTTYRGIYSKDKEITLFNDDIYNNEISAFVNNYYIIADYNQIHEFKYFYIVNLNNNDVFKLKSKYDISFDSYIQGIVDGRVYLYDRNSETQYEINIENKSIKLISDGDKIRYYRNNNWESISAVKANKKMLFDYTNLDNDFSNYDYVIENDKYGIYYLLKEERSYYNIYKVNRENINIIKYLFKTKTNNIKYNNDYLYFVDKNNLYYYSDKTGLRTMLTNTELEFNDTIKFYIY